MSSGFPSQKLTISERISKYGSLEEFAKQMLTSVEGIAGLTYGTLNDINYQRSILKDLTNGKLNNRDIEYVLKPYGEMTPNAQAEMRYYDRLSSKLHTLFGDEIKRPFVFRATPIDATSLTTIQREKTEEVLKMFDKYIQAQMDEAAAKNPPPPPQPGEQPPPPQDPRKFNEYVNTNYKCQREIVANKSMQYLMEQLKLKDMFNDGFQDLYTTGDDIYFTGIRNGEPVARRVNPFNFYYDQSSEIKYIEDSSWAMEYRWIPASKVYDEFGDVLTDNQIQYVENLKGSLNQMMGYGGTTANINYDETLGSFRTNSDYGFNINSNTIIKVTHFVWKSLAKVGFVKYYDEESAQELEKMVDDTYKKQPDDIEINWEWINQTWEVTRIGQDVFIEAKPRIQQYRTIDNPQKTRLPYTGVSNMKYSVVNRVKEMIYLYCIYMYRLEIEVSKASGKVLLFDVAQIPRSEGFDMEKWLYYLKSMGIAFINSFEEGKRGTSAGQLSRFNQFNSIDLTLSASINQYIGILDKLDALITDIIGISPQRQGQLSQYNGAQATEMAVDGSNSVTEYLYYTHNECKRRVMTNLLEEAKYAWKKGKKGKIVLDDLSEIILDLDKDELIDADYGVFITNSGKDIKSKQLLEQYASNAMANNQASLADVLRVINTDSISDSIRILELSRTKLAQEAQQNALQQQEQQHQNQMQIEQFKDQALDKQRAFEAEQNQLDRDMEIRKTEITSLGFASATPTDTDDKRIIEEAKNGIAELKIASDVSIKKAELGLKSKEIDMKSSSELAKLQVERENMANDIKVAEINKQGRQNNSKK